MLSAHIGYIYTNPNTAIDTENLTAFTPDDPGDDYIISLAAHLQKAIPHSLANIIRDEDVHNGYIFTSNEDNNNNNDNDDNSSDNNNSAIATATTNNNTTMHMIC
jgi:hypothetical protein